LVECTICQQTNNKPEHGLQEALQHQKQVIPVGSEA